MLGLPLKPPIGRGLSDELGFKSQADEKDVEA